MTTTSASTSAEEPPPSCRDLIGTLAQTDRRDAFAALALGATSVAQVAQVAEVAERAGLRPGGAEVRSRVLAVVADSFEAGVAYSEAKVNAICGQWFDDWVTLRRALVDEELLRRDESGTRYARA